MNKGQLTETQQEIIFLNCLGTFATKLAPVRELLEKYIKAAEKRVNWDGIDKHRVVTHAINLLRRS